MSDDIDVSQYTDDSGNADMSKIEAEAERRGLNAAEKQGFVADVIRRVSITVKKGKAVVDDAETGAEYGSVIPGFGTALGTAAGAAYGVYTEFGDDIKSALGGGPRWSEDDYNRMRAACRAAGGVSVPGKPPNNLDSCQFPDGTLSGGDAPVWASQAEYEADRATRAANLNNLSSYIDGLKRLDGVIAAADAAVRKAAKAPGNAQRALGTRATWMKKIGNAFATLYNATKLPDAPSANVAGFLNDISPRIYSPPPDAFAGTFKTPTKNIAAALNLAESKLETNRAVMMAKMVRAATHVVAIKLGDPAATVGAQHIVDVARAGHPVATADANMLALAHKLAVRQSFVDKWVHGIIHP